MTEQFVFAVRKSNRDLIAWLNCLTKRFGKPSIKQIIDEQSLTGIKRVERG